MVCHPHTIREIPSQVIPPKPLNRSELDLYFLDLALRLAVKGKGAVSASPLVGAVVVKGGIIVGMGFHLDEGVKHAEVLALEEASQLAHSLHFAQHEL
jgi:pyrimidine deaminase RibD-like protein